MVSADPCTEFEERAAILEHEGGMPRARAEWKARQMLTLVRDGQIDEWDQEAKTRKAVSNGL